MPKLQVIESHRVGNAASGAPPPGMVDGIMFGPYGAPEYYNILRSDGSSRQVPANAVLHLYEPELASGARAYSPLQHSINNIIDMMEILSLEKLAVKTSSDITRTITRENPQFDGSQSDFEAFGMRPQDYGNNGLTDPNEASTFIGGKILSLAPGEKLESFESNRPNQAFTGFIDHLIRDSLSGFLPYEFTYDPTKIGGASVRLIIDKFIMPSHTIELSETESNNLMQLLDLAIKAHGLNVAEAAVTIAQKVVAAKQLKPVANGKKG